MTEDTNDEIAKVPLVFRAGALARGESGIDGSVVTCEDSLPTAVVLDPMGYVLERGTLITMVDAETTDDK
jgi:hypothetical protein